MGNQKLIAGAVMVLLNLVLLSPIATSMVEGQSRKNSKLILMTLHVQMQTVLKLKKTGQHQVRKNILRMELINLMK